MTKFWTETGDKKGIVERTSCEMPFRVCQKACWRFCKQVD